MYVEAVFWTLFLSLWSAEAGMLGDQCDWAGSGLTSPDERGVTPVYFHCREGSVSWKYPRGALRLIFKPSMPVNERDFRVCIRVMRRPDPPDLFYGFKPVDTGPPERFPARIFMEGARRLVPLYAPDDGDPRELRCFRSRRGRAALYVEAEPEDGTKRSQAIFKYEAQPIVKKHYDPATADCRPCTDSELELAFCTSDLVSRGVIVGSEQREDLDTTQLTLRLTKLIRATGEAAVGDTAPLDQDDDDDDDSWSDNRVGSLRTGGAHVAVQVPAACGAAAGAGEFVLLAARRLGTFSLRCAPRADHWAALAQRRTIEGDALCKLHH